MVLAVLILACRQDTKPDHHLLPPTTMGSIIPAALAVGVVVLVAVFHFRANPQPGSVHGDFRFDRSRQSALSKHGLLNKTKWGCFQRGALAEPSRVQILAPRRRSFLDGYRILYALREASCVDDLAEKI